MRENAHPPKPAIRREPPAPGAPRGLRALQTGAGNAAVAALLLQRVTDPPDEMPATLRSLRAGLTEQAHADEFDALYTAGAADTARVERTLQGMASGKAGLAASLQKRIDGRAPRPPKAPTGEALADVPGTKATADALAAAVDRWTAENPAAPADDWRKRVRAELAHLRRILAGELEATAALVGGIRNNLAGVQGELDRARESEGVTAVGRRMKSGGLTADVDVVADGGRTWYDVKVKRLFGLASGEWADLKPQAERILQVAAGHAAAGGAPPRVVYDFRTGVTPEVAEELVRMGAEVLGERRELPGRAEDRNG